MNNINTLQRYLQENNLDVAYISTPDNIFYMSTFASEPHERVLGVIVFKDTDPILICPKMEMADVAATDWKYEVIGYEDTEDAWELIQHAILTREVDFSNFAIEKEQLTVSRFERLQQLFPVVQFHQIDDQLNNMRVIKNETELTYLRKAAQLADYAIEVGCKEIAEGKTELEILMAIEFELKKRGVAQMSFDTMVLSGPKAASPHGTPGDRKIQQGDFILFDLGVIYNGYCSDITRTVAFGEPSSEQRHIYETVQKAEQAAVDSVKPGVRAMDLDKVARDIITEAGYGEYFPHRLGHGLGISVHEFPSITATNDMVLEENMVFTIEPGIYNTEVAGVRIEDDVVVTKDGVEVLTKFPKELIIL